MVEELVDENKGMKILNRPIALRKEVARLKDEKGNTFDNRKKNDEGHRQVLQELIPKQKAGSSKQRQQIKGKTSNKCKF